MPLIKKIRRIGNGSAVPLDNTLLHLTGMAVGDIVQIEVDGSSLRITPMQEGVGTRRLKPILAKIRLKHGSALRELAK